LDEYVLWMIVLCLRSPAWNPSVLLV
jgi:hypothetical protein